MMTEMWLWWYSYTEDFLEEIFLEGDSMEEDFLEEGLLLIFSDITILTGSSSALDDDCLEDDTLLVLGNSMKDVFL